MKSAESAIRTTVISHNVRHIWVPLTLGLASWRHWNSSQLLPKKCCSFSSFKFQRNRTTGKGTRWRLRRHLTRKTKESYLTQWPWTNALANNNWNIIRNSGHCPLSPGFRFVTWFISIGLYGGCASQRCVSLNAISCQSSCCSAHLEVQNRGFTRDWVYEGHPMNPRNPRTERTGPIGAIGAGLLRLLRLLRDCWGGASTAPREPLSRWGDRLSARASAPVAACQAFFFCNSIQHVQGYAGVYKMQTYVEKKSA